MSARNAAARLAALINEFEQAGHEIHTVGSSVVIDDVKVVMGRLEGDPWIVEVPQPPDPRYRVATESPERYFRSKTGVLHLRDLVIGGDLSESRSRCGLYFDLGKSAIPLKVNEMATVCKKCHRMEPSL